MSLRAFVLSIAVIVAACSKPDPPPEPAAPIAAPAPPPDPLAACRGCDHRDAEVRWYFIGNYLDAKCAQPVMHATFNACQSVAIPGSASQQLADSIGAHRVGDNVTFRLGRQLTADEVRGVFKKEDGKCIPQGARFKIAPLGCEGKRVCKDERGELSCGACSKLPNGCPDLEGSRVYAVAELAK